MVSNKKFHLEIRDYYFYNDETLSEKENIVIYSEDVDIITIGEKLKAFGEQYPEIDLYSNNGYDCYGFDFQSDEDIQNGSVTVSHIFTVKTL